MTLGSTQPRTVKTPEIFLRVKGDPRMRLTFSPRCVSRLSVENMGTSTSHNPMSFHVQLQPYVALLFLPLRTGLSSDEL
jgi:hypothetical protein